MGARNAARRMAGLAAVLFALGVGACAHSTDWPDVARISDLSGTMTDAERQKALQDMQQRASQTDGGTASEPEQAQ